MATRTTKTRQTKTTKTKAKAPERKPAVTRKDPAKGTRASAGRTRMTPLAAGAPAPLGPRRVVFIDVENTSSEADLLRVLEDLKIDSLGSSTELYAIGNWRVIAQGLGRALAARGAQLVHSAPAVRVPDWSDLWIAVHAGIWLGRAKAGDVIEVVSHDRAFDAVGDAATRQGITFRRITYRAHAPSAETVSEEGTANGRRRRRRRGGRGRARAAAPSGSAGPRPSHAPAVAAHAPAHPPHAPARGAHGAPSHAPVSHDGEEPHGASQDQIQVAIAQLTAADPAAGVNLDRLTVALKAAGFQRPPGSPRLMTRLRRMKDVEVLPNGFVRLIGETAEVASAALATGEAPAPAAVGEGEASIPAGEEAATPVPAKRRPRRRGGRRRSGRGRAAAAPSPPAS